MLIQFILITAIIVIILRLLYQLKNKNIGITQFLGWLVVWLIAIAIIWYPKLTTYLAVQVGVGRGVDLAIYVSVVVVFYILFRLLLRIEKMEKQITKIVRDDALKDNKENEK